MRLARFLLLLLIATGCADSALTPDPSGTEEPRIEIEAPVTALIQGATTRFSATYYDDTGRAVPQTPFTWTSSSPSVATVSDDGTVTATAPGHATIRAAAHSIESDAVSLTVVVDANHAAHVTVAPASATLQPGETLQLVATVTNVDGAPLPAASVVWTSEAPGVATVDAEGLVTGVAPGTTALTATADGVTSEPATVEVPPQIRRGLFTPAPNHDAEGTATLVRQSGGDLLLTFQSDFRVTDGPGLYVFLSPVNGVDEASYQVALLTSAEGEQSYLIRGVGLYEYDYVAVYCVPFGVLFGTAQFQE